MDSGSRKGRVLGVPEDSGSKCMAVPHIQEMDIKKKNVLAKTLCSRSLGRCTVAQWKLECEQKLSAGPGERVEAATGAG